MKNTVKKSLSAVLAVLMLLSCFCFSVSAEEGDKAGYEVLRQTCTVYGDAKTQRGFSWFTQDDCDGVVQVVKATDYHTSGFDKAVSFEAKTKSFQGYYNHKAVATGLTKGVTYYYRVGSLENNVWGADSTFFTDNGDGSFTFIAIADVQASNYDNFHKASLVMDAAMDTFPKAELVVNLGDFVNDCTNEEWNDYGKAFGKANSQITLAPVAGNHEGNITNKLNVGWFNTTFNLENPQGLLNGTNGTFYSFDYGNAHFCVLNTNDMYPMTEAQRNWIVNDLSASDAQWKILLTHRAPYSAGKNINKPDTVLLREMLIEIVDQTDVDLVLSGHDHMYMRTKQVKGDAVCEDTKYVTEVYNGVETTFAVNPDGTIYALPSTAGTKRYGVNDSAMDPIFDCADVYFTTRSERNEETKEETNPNAGGCFAGITIDGNKLIYNAYVLSDIDEENPDAKQVLTNVDNYAIKKTVGGQDVEDTYLPTDPIGTIDQTIANFFTAIPNLIISYIKMLIGGIL
ncbi:MAG: metallophosphoesterase family protein [Clostridia bacterium]|nr:metallophosphoesterase family protein [Clostridia bacterium]